MTTKRLERGHRGGGDDRVQQAGDGERDRGDVVGEGPEEVALDRAQGPSREADRVGGGAQVAGDERQVGRLDRDVGAGADREAEVGLRERGRVVDAVADHRHDLARCLQALDLGDLVVRVDLGEHALDADLGGDPLGGLARRRRSAARASARAPSARAIASALVGLTVSRTTSVARATPSQATVDVAVAAADLDVVALDDAGDADARARCGSPRPAAARRAPRARPRDRLRDRMLARPPRRRPARRSTSARVAPFSGATSASSMRPR